MLKIKGSKKTDARSEVSSRLRVLLEFILYLYLYLVITQKVIPRVMHDLNVTNKAHKIKE